MIPVEVEAVTKRFGSFVAVDEVDLTVHAGGIVGLVGANGAGKTTLMRMILGLLEPTHGTVALFGEAPTRQGRRRIGYVPQNLGLYRDLTATENLEFRATTFGAEPADAGTEPLLIRDQPLGVQRRVAFTAATQHDPDLLVLDEPTSGVSPLSRTVLWNLIRERAEQGVGVLVSTHYMDEAEQADRIVLMSHGRVVAEGSLTDVIGGRTVTEVVTDRWQAAFEALDRDGRPLTLSGTTIRVLDEDRDRILATLEREGIEADLGTAAATLDEAMVVLES
jgi:ABC-2 type transport system ATP-binding protein